MPANKIWQLSRSFVITIITLLLVLGVVSLGLGLLGYTFVIVTSGSMAPALPVGSVVVVQPNSDYKVGEIVTYKEQANLVTHRIVSIQDGNVATKGDANTKPDTQMVSKTSMLGKVWVVFPGIGYGLLWLRTPVGFVLGIIVPGLILMVNEFSVIKREVKKIKAKPFLSCFLVIGLLLISQTMTKIETTSAYFSDLGLSRNNTLVAAANFPHIVINEIYYNVCSACGTDPQNEWLELYNPTASAINLTGWSLTDNSSSDLLPSGTLIPSGGFLVVTDDVTTFTFWPNISSGQRIVLNNPIGNGLANTGDRILLKNNLGSVVDQVSYGSDTTSLNPAIPVVTKGHSSERSPAGFDSDKASDFVDRTSPQPGL